MENLLTEKPDDGEQSNDSDLIILESANSPTPRCQNPPPSGYDEAAVNYVSSDTDDDADNANVGHADVHSVVEHSNYANVDGGNEGDPEPTPLLHTVSDGEDCDEDVILM